MIELSDEKYPLLREYFGYYKGAVDFGASQRILIDIEHLTAAELDRWKAETEAMRKYEIEAQKFHLLDRILDLFSSGMRFTSGLVPSLDNYRREVAKLSLSRLNEEVQNSDLKITELKDVLAKIDEAVFSGKDIQEQLRLNKSGGQPISLHLDLRNVTGRPPEFLRTRKEYDYYAAMWREGAELLNEIIAFYESAKEIYANEIKARTENLDATISQLQKKAAELCKEAVKIRSQMQKLSVQYQKAPSQDVLSEYCAALQSFRTFEAQYRSILFTELSKITVKSPVLTEFPVLMTDDLHLTHDHLSYHHCNVI
jgi:hypothetical protein